MPEVLDAIALKSMQMRSRKAEKAKLPLSFIRELAEADLPAILNPPEGSRGKTNVFEPKRIRARHHLLAMMLANGASTADASFATGYTPQTIRTLTGVPAFNELLEYYCEQQAEAFDGFAKQAAAVGMEALSILQERMEDSPDDIKVSELTSLAEMLFDRTILPAKGGKNSQGPAVVVQPVTMIQFVDSPQSAETPQIRQALIEGKAT